MVILTADELGLLLRARRRELGWDQQTLAARIGASRLWVVEFEKGKPRAEVGLVLRALAALGLRIDVIPETSAAMTTEEASSPLPDIDAVVRAARKKRR